MPDSLAVTWLSCLLGSGGQVTVIDDASTGSFDNLANVAASARLRAIRGNVNDRALLRELVGQVDVIYHLAASVGVQRIVDVPIESIERNNRQWILWHSD